MIGLEKRVVLLIGSLACMAACVFAAPFAKQIEFVQPDGTQIQLWGEGDEFYAVFETLDGYTVTFDDALKGYVYAAVSADGSQLISAGLEVGKGDPLTLGLEKHLRISPEARQRQVLERSQKWDAVTGTGKRWTALKNTRLQTETLMEEGPVLMSPPASHTLGQKMGLTLLIDFDNDPATITKANIEQFCNGDAYTGFGNNGSVKKYYLDNSGGLLIYSNAVTAYIRIPNSLHPKSYYNDISKDCGLQARLLIQDAITIMKARPDYVSDILPTFAAVTVNGANQAVAFNVFYAGGNGNRWMYGLWPHSWSLAAPIELSPGGKKVYNYEATNIGDTLELGTFCHENGHMLCDYPDIYDYQYDSTGGAGGFCLMNSGGHGHNPVQICAYLKYASGWSETVEMDYKSNLQATLVSTIGQPGFNRFYRYEKPGTATEYFLFENRQKTGRDSLIAASGIAIWHIDELGDKDIQSLEYNSVHYNYECTLVQADNLWHFQNNVNSGDANDLYYQGNTAAGYTNQFNDMSQPSARWWDGTKSKMKVRDFSASGPIMTFNIVPPPPVMLSVGALPPGRVGTAYSYTFAAAGAVAPYTWSLVPSNSLAALNLTLSSAGVLSGVPEIETNVVFDVAVFADNLTSITNTFSLVIQPVLGIPFTETFENGGLIADSWTQESVSGTLPWEFRAGSPNQAPSSAHGGAYNASLALTASGQAVTRLISPRIDFGDGATSGQLTFWHFMSKWIGRQDELRVYYRTTLTGPWIPIDDGVYTNSVTSWTKRTLTLPSPSRTYYIAFVGTAKYGYGICIDDVEVIDPYIPLAITTASLLPTATTDVPYSQSLTAIGGITNAVTPYTFALVPGEGDLPNGLGLSASGVISGTPTTVGTNTFTVSVTDVASTTVSKTFTLMVDLPRANLYEENFENEGLMPYGWTQEYVTNQVPWTIAEGGKYGHPSGPVSSYHNVILWSGAWTNGASFNQKTRLISPAINLGQSPANVRLTFWHCMESWEGKQDELRVLYRRTATNAWAQVAAFTSNVPVWTAQTVVLPEPSSTYYIAFEGNAQFGYGICLDDVSISDAAVAPIIITPMPLAVGRIQTPYSQALEAVGGKPDYAWAIVAGALPAGVDIDPVSGLLSGTPTVGGTFSFSVRVMGSDGKSSVNVYSLRILDSMTIPFVEHFENGGTIPLGWTQYRVSGVADWTFRAGSASGTPATAYTNQYNACLYVRRTDSNQSMLVSPVLDFATATNNTQLTFWHMMKNSGGFQDQLRVYYRTAQDGEWILLATYTSDVPVWTKRTIALPNPGSTYQLAFSGTAKYGYGVCIDEISITGVSPLSSYEIWLRTKLTPDEIAAGLNLGSAQDFDGDGIINALEYAYGMDPTVADLTGLPYGGIRDNHLFMVYRQNVAAPEVVFLIEACTSLVDHAWSPVDISEFSRAATNTWEVVTRLHNVPVPNAPQRFMRLKVTVP